METVPQTARTRRPILIGLAVVLASVAAGVAAAFATGMAQPVVAKAFSVLPPCCAVPPPPPVPVVPVTPPPVIIPDPLPPCCTTESPTPPPPPAPTPDVLPPCCTETPSQPEAPVPSTPPAPDVLPPCCTTESPTPPPPVTTPPTPVVPTPAPETPIVPVVPPPVPPPPVPPPPAPLTARCVSLTATPNQIAAGQTVTIAWQYENATSITITANGSSIGTFTTSSGSITANPTVNTTYVGTVTDGANSDTCSASVTITVNPTAIVPACVQLTASPNVITSSGQAVTLSWVLSNASTITISNVDTFTGSTGSVTVNPTGNTTYVGTVPGAPANPACEASVRLETDNNGGGGNGGGGGGGGRRNPRVVFDSVSRPAEAPLGVFLSEVPYTGLDLGPFGTAVYWTVLTLWSLAAAYLVLFGLLPFAKRKLAMAAAAAESEPEPAPDYSAHVMPQMSLPAAAPEPTPAATMAAVTTAAAAAAHVAPQAAPAPQPVFAAPGKVDFTGEGFKRFAAAPTLTIEDIVKGLSRESGMEFAQPEPAPQIPAHTDAAQHAPVIAPQPAPVASAPEAAPRQQPVTHTIMVNDDIMGFINALLAGERDQVFGLIRRMNQAGHDVEAFIAHAIFALDDAYRARIDGTPVHDEVKRATEHCATPFLERLVTSLTTAVDGSYSMGVTGIKLAITRALAVANG